MNIGKNAFAERRMAHCGWLHCVMTLF